MLNRLIDSTDAAILEHLQTNAKLTNVALASKVHLSPSPCLARVRALERDRIISRYVTVLDARSVGLGVSVYPAEFRQQVRDVVAAGRRVREVAIDLGISKQTVYSWRRQERVDQGIAAGLTSAERAELAAARRRIRELEAELAIHRKATELLKGTTSPKEIRGRRGDRRAWPAGATRLPRAQRLRVRLLRSTFARTLGPRSATSGSPTT